jgi:alpha-beta hydrolase superfamily lysophospholipase
MPNASTRKPACKEGFVTARDGVELFYRQWRPEASGVTSVVLFIHGIGLHGSSAPYGDKVLIPELLGRGTGFYSIDLRGHGRSGGDIERIAGNTLVQDVDCHVQRIREEHGNVPVYLYGHNFGGILSLYYASACEGNVRGVIVAEYSKRIKSSVKRIMKPNTLSALMSRTIDRIRGGSSSFRFLNPVEYERLCSRYHIPVDDRILNSLKLSRPGESKMVYGKEFFSACGVGRETQIARKVRSPVLMIFARNDPFFDVRGAYDVLTRTGSFDKTLIQVDIEGHYSVIESSKDHISRWIAKRLPGSIS